MKNLILFLLSFCMSFNIYAQNYSVNLNIAKPKVKAVDNKENLRNIIYYAINEAIIDLSDFVTVVERENLEFINKKRSRLKKDDNPKVGAAVMVGANYILESKVSDVKFISETKKVKKLVKKKLETKYVFSESVKFIVDFELVNIATGEIDFQYRMNIDGLGYKTMKTDSLNTKDVLVKQAMTDAKGCLSSVIKYMISSVTLVKSQIVDINEIKKDKAKTILIQGGFNTPFRKGSKFDIVKVYSQDLGGEVVERKEKIGEAKYKEAYKYLSKCSVSKGSKEVLAAFQEGATLYCIPVELKHLPTCGYGLYSSARKSLHYSYKSAIKSDSDSNAKKISLTKKKPKNTKKVKRKSGN